MLLIRGSHFLTLFVPQLEAHPRYICNFLTVNR